MLKKKILMFIWICIIILSCSGCSNDNKEDIAKEKLKSELSYLDSEILTMLNTLNNISFQNYEVITEKLNKQSSDSSSSSNSESNNDSKTQSGNQSGSSSDSQSGSSQGNSENMYVSKMIPKGILLNNYEPNWDELKSNIEKLYSSWSTIIIDLYNTNVNNYDILGFSDDLEQAIVHIKNEDKANSLAIFAKLYSYIPVFSNSSSQDNEKTSIYYTKSNILNAYALIERDDWNGIANSISEADKSYANIIKNINEKTEKQAKISKAYTLLKELQNSLELKDKEIFYIKYKALIQELNDL